MNRTLLVVALALAALCSAAAQKIRQITGDAPRYVISVKHAGNPIGDIEIELFPDVAPLHCKNFDSLVAIKFYDGTAFHRVIPGFMIQGGDPNSRSGPESTWGFGDPSQKTVPAEFSSKPHLRGIISGARLGNDINSFTSQFFICVADARHLDGQYTVHGQVVKGMNVVDSVVNLPRLPGNSNRPVKKVEMTIVKSAPSGVQETETDDAVGIFPNPTNGNLWFSAGNGGFTVVEYRIFDVAGTVYAQQSGLRLPVGEFTVAMPDLPAGVYALWLRDAEGKGRRLRFVVQP